MSQIWKLVGSDGEPYARAVPRTLGGHHGNRIYGRLDCPAALHAIAQAAMSPTVSSSSPKSTRGPPVTVPAPSASQWLTQVGKHSKAMYRVAVRYLRQDGGRLSGEPFTSDVWNANTLATHHNSEGATAES